MKTLDYPEQKIKKAWEEMKNINEPKLEEELIFAQDFLIYILLPRRSADPEKTKEYNRRADQLGLKLTNFSDWWESRKKFYREGK